jgi:RNA-directed DNA polymerase
MSNNLIVWNNIEWHNVRKRIIRYQTRIFKASKENNLRKVKSLQRFVINSLDAKLLAVKMVTTENKGSKTAGIDKITYLSNKEKSLLVSKLRIDGKANPIMRTFIPKPGKSEMRPLGIPTLEDRAKQYIILLALEPEWEARFEANSYGFRPGRNCHDAVSAIYQHLKLGRNKSNFKKYVLDADIKSFFDSIDHDYLLEKLNTLPEIRTQVHSWLKAGITNDYLSADKYNLVPANRLGTPQGGIISPFLANVALHGLETHLKEWISNKSIFEQLTTGKKNYLSKRDKMKSLGIIRYADDFVIIHKDLSILEQAKTITEDWLLNTSKVRLNPDKTRIVCSDNGFTFLGFRFINVIRNEKKRIKIYPEKSAVKNLITKIGNITRTNRAISSYDLIQILRPIIIGWGNYYSISECGSTFHKTDHDIFGITRSWVFRRDRRNNRTFIKEKYFPSNKTYTFRNTKHKDNWILCGQKKLKNNRIKDVHLPRLQWIKSKTYIKVLGNASIYDGNNAYWASRSLKYGNWSPTQRKLLNMQKGNCNWCNSPIILNDVVEIDHIIPISQGGKDIYKNYQLLHKHCHIEKTSNDLKSIPTTNKNLNKIKKSYFKSN